MGAEDERERLRRAAVDRRNALAPASREARSRAITERFWDLPEVAGARTLFVSLSVGSEVSTRALVAEARRRGLRVAVPVTLTAEQRLLPCDLPADDRLAAGPFGILEPGPDARVPVAVDRLDLAVVPGAAFDPQGNRLGWGAGYYDRLLADLRPGVPIVALAFECQLVSVIPVEPHDIPVAVIVTEQRVIRPERSLRETHGKGE
ncbi:MAG TPA: 5-formyltetrahydrofolate cyclo-ligase [Nitrospiria bacterium]|nr:5-formyltetrahydrofolate cyclo-ligase [Nitrospiria bacterium]